MWKIIQLKMVLINSILQNTHGSSLSKPLGTSDLETKLPPVWWLSGLQCFQEHKVGNSHCHSANKTEISVVCFYVLQNITTQNTLNKYLTSGVTILLQAHRTSWKIRGRQNQGTGVAGLLWEATEWLDHWTLRINSSIPHKYTPL